MSMVLPPQLDDNDDNDDCQDWLHNDDKDDNDSGVWSSTCPSLWPIFGVPSVTPLSHLRLRLKQE